ncbi:hem peroxidase [Arabidopsis suecica]|uniref:peroxidase n=1 Tax=Arabidopsis suecica TaxID=45249 RepID=A0A8T2BV42_ARASU|nr:hem peroxidase [Arabidopsis suecica]
MKMMITFVISYFMLLNLNPLEAQLSVGFYADKCPTAESVVRAVIRDEVKTDPRNAAVLLRLQFHDCFVLGCDGSILLKNDDDGTAAPGNAGVGGFSVIEDAKAALEKICPGVVSCADVVALAARDAVSLSNGPFFEVPTGRRDGRVSRAEDAANLPDSEDSIEILKSKFGEKGLTEKDLVLLSAGAHTIGQAACFFVNQMLDSAPPISPEFFGNLRSRCPEGGDVNVKLPLDWDGELLFDTHIFTNIKSGRAVISSDAVLYQDPATKKLIDAYATNSSAFAADFAGAMVKLGRLNVKLGGEGEVRRFCNIPN